MPNQTDVTKSPPHRKEQRSGKAGLWMLHKIACKEKINGHFYYHVTILTLCQLCLQNKKVVSSPRHTSVTFVVNYPWNGFRWVSLLCITQRTFPFEGQSSREHPLNHIVSVPIACSLMIAWLRGRKKVISPRPFLSVTFTRITCGHIQHSTRSCDCYTDRWIIITAAPKEGSWRPLLAWQRGGLKGQVRIKALQKLQQYST